MMAIIEKNCDVRPSAVPERQRLFDRSHLGELDGEDRWTALSDIFGEG
jgi:hypothetical protein